MQGSTRAAAFWVRDARGLNVHQVQCPDAPTLTANGLQIKSAANIPANYQLLLEEPGETPDRKISDSEALVLNNDSLSTFFAVPPAHY